MKRFSVWLVLACLCTFTLFAQTKEITISGRVLESDSKVSAPQATIQLLALPDSAYVTGIASSEQGWFKLPKVKAGKYVLKISYIGFKTKMVPVQLTNSAPDKKLGVISLEPDAVMLKEAVIVAEVPQVVAKEDTLEYNSAAYRTPEGAMLEELVKKLPGAEIDDDGNIKINGKQVKKIMVDGKEFFGGDVKTGLKNLPVNMVDKLKTYDKKSDMARVTGIDDGEEETVLDLKVKKGMNQGWFGNAGAAIGTEDRYASNLMLNRFVDKNQFSLIGSANNVNDQGFSGGGGGARFRSNNGLNASKTLGANFATETEKLELGGSAKYTYNGRDAVSTNYSELFLQGGKNSFSNSNSRSRSSGDNFNADFRLEWKPDTLTNIIFRPTISYGKSNSLSASESGRFSEDPLNFISNPNAYLDLNWLKDHPEEDPLKAVRVNVSNNNSSSESRSLSTNGTLQLNRKLNSRGRNLTLRGVYGYSDGDNDRLSEAVTYVNNKETGRIELDPKLSTSQFIATPTKNYEYRAQVTYSEPIAKATFLQFSYQFQHKYSVSDRRTYDLKKMNWEFEDPIPAGYEEHYVDSLSKKAEYNYYNHDFTVSLRLIREKYQLTVGASLQPQNTSLKYKKAAVDTLINRSVANFAPNIDFRFRFSKVSQLRLIYRGNASQPSMESLLPDPDYSNPLNIRLGNPGLKPSFNHSMRASYNTYNAERQQNINVHGSFSLIQNSISNVTRYNPDNGGTIVQPENINGNWNAFGMFGFSTAFKDKRFTINTYSRATFRNDVGMLYDRATLMNEKNTSTTLTLGENLNGTFRNDWFEFSLNGSISYNFERNKLSPQNNQEPYSFGYGASTNVYLPWSMSVSTNIMNSARRGYRDASMNRNELIWNAQISQNFLKGKAATISFEIYDILKQQTNISRSMTADMRSVSEYNGVNSYCMLRFAYRLNVFGGKNAREGDRRGGEGGRPARSTHGGSFRMTPSF